MDQRHGINRREFLSLVAGSAAGLCFTGPGRANNTAGTKTTRLNIVLIVSDDQGYGDASCYFHPPHVHTPNIDRLAAEGVRLTNAYASGWVCAPTRAGLMTGRYQQRFGFYTAADSRIGIEQ